MGEIILVPVTPFREGFIQFVPLSLTNHLPKKRARILLADDTADMREFVRGPLSQVWDIETVADGEAALASVRAHPPDLILSDVRTPKLDGFQLLKTLRSEPDTHSLPFVLLSDRTGEAATMEGLQAGANDYLVKPFTANELISRVEMQLRLIESRREVHAERAKITSLFMQAPAAIALLRGPLHKIELINECAKAIHGGIDFTGQTLQEAMPHLIDQGFGKIFDEIYATGQPRSYSGIRAMIRQLDGTMVERYYDTVYQPWRDSDGQVIGILTFSIDVTEQVLARHKVEKLASELTTAVTSRDEFLSIASHELKTPITSLKLQLQMTKRQIKPDQNQTPTPQRLAAAVETSLRQTERLTELIEDLLDVSRIRAGKLIFDFQHIGVSQLVREVVERFSDQLDAAKCPVSISIEPHLFAKWDRSRIEQVIVNLVSNAVKYASGKPIHIRTYKESEKIVISVRDFGPGITDEQRPLIFERFERATSSRNISGLGLGLYIVRRVVEGHGGTIRVENPPTLGTHFIVELPILCTHPEETSIALH